MGASRDQHSVSYIQRRREISFEFVRAFCACELDHLKELLSADLSFTGPLFRSRCRADYLGSLYRDPPTPTLYKILRVFESPDGVCVLYEYGQSEQPVLVSQFNRFSGPLISEILLVFDTSSVSRPLELRGNVARRWATNTAALVGGL